MSSILDTPLSSSPNTVWRERRAFAYYFQHAAPFVGGQLDLDFWKTIVPQVCRTEPAVWDAIIAISALFESPEPYPNLDCLHPGKPRALNQNHRDALNWYSRSVSGVRQRIERGSVDTFVGLISCVLFICIEALQGHVEEALRLYGQGGNLVLALRAQIACGAVTATNAALLEDTIVPIFARLGSIARAVVSNLLRSLIEDTEPTALQEFHSLKSARETIILLTAEIHSFQTTCAQHHLKFHASHLTPELINRQTILSAKLGAWRTAFTSLMVSLHPSDTVSPNQIGTVALIIAHYEMLSIMIAVCVSSVQMITDAYLPNFETIVEQSGIALDALARSDGTQAPYTFDITVVLPLFFTCLRCREPGIRRRALALLERAPQVQGFYKSISAVLFVRQIMALEEQFAAQLRNNSTMLGPTNVNCGYQRPTQAHGDEISGCDSHSSITSLGSESAASPYSIVAETGAMTATRLLIPEEARIGPVNVFWARDGFPPETAPEDIAKWNQNPDQRFLHFTRNQYDVASNTWHMVPEIIPAKVSF
ncbi:hypothetical protein AOCH_002010 [Aspergillus ochraceoroseus]|nr:hypothetical protein AOCH_002010 [Aspergillus ochraceoroseus]